MARIVVWIPWLICYLMWSTTCVLFSRQNAKNNMAYPCCFWSFLSRLRCIGTLKKLLNHIKFSHSHDCSRSFKKFNIQGKHTKMDKLEDDVNGLQNSFNPLTPVPPVTAHDEPWPFFHFWHHHLWPNLASSILNFCRRKRIFPMMPSSQWLAYWNLKYAQKCSKS